MRCPGPRAGSSARGERREELVLAPIGLLERLLGLMACRDVQERADAALGVPFLVEEGNDIFQEFDDRPVGKDQVQLDTAKLDPLCRGKLHGEFVRAQLAAVLIHFEACRAVRLGGRE